MSNGDTRTRSGWATGILLLAALLFRPSAWAADPNPAAGGVISINFTALDDASAVLASTESAGVIPRANWNNIQYNGNTYGVNPTDDTGTTLASTFVNCRLSPGYPGKFSYTSTVGNDYLMKSYCGNDETKTPSTGPLIRVSGLPASFLANGYSMYVYNDFNNNSGVLRKFDLGTSLLDPNNPSAGITDVRSTATKVELTDWLGTGNPTGIFTEGADGSDGNYLVFRDQTAGEFAIFPICAGPARVAINGIQIVANTAPGEAEKDEARADDATPKPEPLKG